MSEVIGKAFEEDIQLYQNRLDNITDTLKSLSAMGISINVDTLNSMRDAEKDVHIDTVAMQILTYEYEKDAK